MGHHKKTLWELLWDYDPNGLIVVDLDMNITVVNPSLCGMLNKKAEDIIGKKVNKFFDDVEDFQEVWEKGETIKAKEKSYPKYGLHVRKVIFPIKDENMIACIMVDVTHEYRRKNEISSLKDEAIERVHQVVDKQMNVVQQIAGLLGETTAETKVSLLKLVEMLKREES